MVRTCCEFSSYNDSFKIKQMLIFPLSKRTFIIHSNKELWRVQVPHTSVCLMGVLCCEKASYDKLVSNKLFLCNQILKTILYRDTFVALIKDLKSVFEKICKLFDIFIFDNFCYNSRLESLVTL